MQEDLEKFLKKFNCRGCSNHCPLNDPMCGRSKIFIEEAMKKR